MTQLIFIAQSSSYTNFYTLLRNRFQTIVRVFTARVRSTREGTVFTGVCLSTFRGGTYLPASRQGGAHLLRSGPGGGGEYLPWWGGVPTFPGLDGGDLPSGQGSIYLPRSGWGVPTFWVGGTCLGRGVPTFPDLDGGYLPWQGVPT